MLEKVKFLSETVAPVLKILGVLFVGYVILMGYAHRRGRLTWVSKENQRRSSQGRPTINLLSRNPMVDVPWKDPSLIQGGLTAIFAVIILLSYVVMGLLSEMLFSQKLVMGDLLDLLLFLMVWPVSMGGFLIGVMIWQHRHRNAIRSLWGLIVIALVGFISSFAVPFVFEPPETALIVEIALLVILSFLLSYLIGMNQGITEADIEKQFPLVEVLTTQNETISQVRLYEKTDTDYRLIGEDGVNHIIPSVNIREIRHRSLDSEKPPSPPTETLAPQ